MIYLDANATTPMLPEVREAMLPWLTEKFGNPSSGHRAGKEARRAVEEARGRVAELIGAAEEEIVFTSGGTESNNAALAWLGKLSGGAGGRMITSAIEHSAVLRVAEHFEEGGLAVIRCGVDGGGRLDLEVFRETCREAEMGGGFVSLMWVNNEIGVIQPVAEACAAAKEHGLAFHSDAIQAAGKVEVDVRAAAVDFLSLSAHKFHGPKGVGALYVRSGCRFEPLLRGGGQEKGRRSGTENVAGIVGMGKAAEMARNWHSEEGRLAALRDEFEASVVSGVEGVSVNGDLIHRVANTSHLAFSGCEAAGLLILLDQAGVACSAGSACMTGKQKPSHVQKAMGFSDAKAKSSLRFSFSQLSTTAEAREAAGRVIAAVRKLRQVQGNGGVGPVVVYSS